MSRSRAYQGISLQETMLLFTIFFFFFHLVLCSTNLVPANSPEEHEQYRNFLLLLNSVNSTPEQIEASLSSGKFRLPDTGWHGMVRNVETLKVCLNHYTFESETAPGYMFAALAARLISKYGDDDRETVELMHFCLDQLASSSISHALLENVLRSAVEGGNVKLVTLLLEQYGVPSSRIYVQDKLFRTKAKCNMEGHNDLLKIFYMLDPEDNWDLHVERYMQSRFFKPETLEWLLERNYPKTYLEGLATLMDAAIKGTSPKLADVCIKYCIPPSRLTMLKWKTEPKKMPLHQYLRREEIYQTITGFMANCVKNGVLPVEMVKEIEKLYIQANIGELALGYQ